MSNHPTIETLLEGYARYLAFRNRAPATIAAYIGNVRDMLRHIPQHPFEITREHLYLWDGLLAARKLSENSRARMRVAVKSFLHWVSAEYNTPDLAEELVPIRQRVSQPVVLHPDDLTQILHAQDESKPIHARDAAIVTLLAATGLRLSELTALNCGDVSRRTVGLGDKKRTVFAVRVETAKRGRTKIRTINFGNPEDPADVATRHFGLWYMQKLQMLGSYAAASDLPLFSDATDFKKRLRNKAIYTRVKMVVKRSGRTDLLKHIHPHSFRHYFATWRMATGGDIFALKQDLGHSQTSTTELYVHLAQKATGEQAIKHNPLAAVIAKPLAANIPIDQFRQIAKILIPESNT